MRPLPEGADDPRLWVQIAGGLRGKLAAGVIIAGDRVSIEHVAREWRVSRQTAAKALQALEADGLVRRYPGIGYWVPSPGSPSGKDGASATGG